MASVSSLDKDLRTMRLSRYTPQAASEVREWVEEILGGRLPSGDLLEALKDGVALCRLANLALGPPGVRYKESRMPFVQMENISHFLRACQSPPISLPQHDTFLTVDLYESKDPAQVLQCIIAFSRRANAVQPGRFPRAIGGKSKGGVLSPQGTGTADGGRYIGGNNGSYNRSRGTSNVSDTSSTAFNSTPRPMTATERMSPVRTGGSNSSATTNGGKPTSPYGGVSSWSKKSDEASTAPAWNIHQYGYMGGASQGNQGISFGGRRQITSAAPKVPSMADKERRRREEEAEKERLRIQAEEAEYKRRVETEAEAERERVAEERRWEEETRKQREREREEAEKEKRRWEEEERRWREEEDVRLKEEKETEARLEIEKQRKRAGSDARLKGQYLSQYQAERRQVSKSSNEVPGRTLQSDRVRELERELEEAKERERQYERERQQRMHLDADNARQHMENHDMNAHLVEKERSRSRSRSREPAALRSVSHNSNSNDESWRASERDYLRREHSHKSTNDSWRASERDYLRREWSHHHPNQPLPFGNTRSPDETPAAPRPLPDPTHSIPVRVKTNNTGPSSRPLPDPATYASPQPQPPPLNPSTNPNRTDPFKFQAPAPAPTTELNQPLNPTTKTTTTSGGGSNNRPIPTKSLTLLEREMQLERQRQQEWEESQKATMELAVENSRAAAENLNPGMGNGKGGFGGGVGVTFGGRRGIIGPRPRP